MPAKNTLQNQAEEGYPGYQIQGLTCQEAGRLGGLSTLERHGRQHFQDIGMMGQRQLASRYGSGARRRWGKLGGRPKKVRFLGAGSGNLLKGREGEPARDPAPTGINTAGKDIHLSPGAK